MSTRTTARERRAALKAEMARVLTRTLFERDVDQGELAEAVGVGASIVQRWADRRRSETMTVADLVLAGQSHEVVARDLLAWVAERLDLELRPTTNTYDTETGRRTIHELLDVVRAITDHDLDGTLDAEEARRELRELREAKDALAEREAQLLAACGLAPVREAR